LTASRPPGPAAARRFRWQPALAAALVVIALGAAALDVWWTGRQDEPPAPGTPPPIPTDLAPDAVTDPPFPSLTYGIHTFLWWNPTARTFDLDMVKLMNFTHVKQRFAWLDIEPAQGEWHWQQADAVVDEVEDRGLAVVARIDGAPDWAVRPLDAPDDAPIDLDAWAEYCGAVAGRYQGRIAGYQVWNEPNLRVEWYDHTPDAAGYVKLLRACSEAIRAADPDAIVISAGLAPTGGPMPDAMPDVDYLRAMYAAGASPYFDVLGMNAPGYADPPDVSPEEVAAARGHRWMAFRHVEDIRAIMVEQGDAAKQMALLEVGWTTDPRPDVIYAWHAVDEATQAKYLVGAYRWAAEHWRPWVGLMVTIYMADMDWTGDDEQFWWALNTPGYPPQYRQAYFDLANMEKVCGDTVIPARDPGSPEALQIPTVLPCNPQ